MDKVLLYFSLKYHGEWDKIYEALDRKEKITQQELASVEQRIDCDYLTIINPLYPTNLKNSHHPPFVLFYKGKIDLLVNYYKIFSFIYENKIENCNQQSFERLVNNFKKEHKTFLLANLNSMSGYINRFVRETSSNYILITDTIASIDNNIDGLIISEGYDRNNNQIGFITRLLVTLATATIVVEVAKKSLLIPVIEQGLNDQGSLFVLPLSVDVKNRANNALIKLGAKLIESSSDVLKDL